MPTWNWLNLIWNCLAIKKTAHWAIMGLWNAVFLPASCQKGWLCAPTKLPKYSDICPLLATLQGHHFLEEKVHKLYVSFMLAPFSIVLHPLLWKHFITWSIAGTVYVVKTQHFGVSLWVCKGCKGSRCLFAWGAIKLPNGVGIDRMFWLSGVGGESLAMSNMCRVGLMFLTNLQMDRRVKVQTKEKHQMPNCFHQGFQPLQWQPS